MVKIVLTRGRLESYAQDWEPKDFFRNSDDGFASVGSCGSR